MARCIDAQLASEINAFSDLKTVLNIIDAVRANDISSLHSIVQKTSELDRNGLTKALASLCCEEDTPLHYAAQVGNPEICEILIEDFKIDVNLTTPSGKTPLCFAANFGDPLTVRFLIRQGAHVNIKDANNFSPLHYVIIGDNHRAIEVLLSRDAPVDVQNFTGSPLLLATLLGHKSCIEVLLDNNANPNELLCGVVTPLLIAVMNNENCTFHPQDETKEIVGLLIKAGADVNKIPVLSLAYHSEELMKYLLASGANPNFLDESGRLPIVAAAMRGKREVVEILYTVTSRIQTVPDWNIEGLLSHFTSEKVQKEWKVLSKKRLVDLKRKIENMLFQKEYLAALVLCNYAIEEDPEDISVYYAKRCFCWIHLGNSLPKMYMNNATTDAKLINMPEVIHMLGKEHLSDMISFQSYLNLLLE